METNVKIPKNAFNEKYLSYLDCEERFLVFFGGAGSGKSYFVAQRYIYKLLKSRECNLLVVRAVDKTNRDSTFALMKQVINRWNLGALFKINEGDMRIKCDNKNSVIFKGLSDVENLKSITFDKGDLTDIWIEEASEIEESDFNQLNTRLRGKGTKKQIVLSFNPVSVNHWLKKRFFDQVRRNNIITVHSTYKDNKFLDEEYKLELEGYKDTDPYHYQVYCLGQWGVTGKSVFNAVNVNEQLAKDIQPVRECAFMFGKMPQMIYGDAIKIYEYPKEGHPYVLGGDTAGEGSDYFTGHVIDNATGKQVAVLRHQYDEDIYAQQMFCLGKYYNTALIAIEANFSTYPIKELQRMGYPKLYVRRKEDTYTGKIDESYGVKTTKVTRPLMISELIKIMRETPDLVVDKGTLEEMLTFVMNEKGRAEAQNGFHDDLVMGLGITHYARGQQTKEVRSYRKTHYTKEMMKDYRRANAEDRRMLEKLWGKPI